MAGGLFFLAILSGTLGLGVAFAAVPFLSLFLHDLVHQAQPHTLIPLLGTAVWDPALTLTLILVGAGGGILGARITSLWVPAVRLKQMFGVLIVLLTAYKIYTLISA